MIQLIKSTFYNEKETKKKLAHFVTRTKKLSIGSECLKFERNFAKWQGRKHCLFVNSGSSANLALIQALLNLGRLKKGDNVGFSALTWSTNVMPLIQLGLNPVPIDINLHTLNVSLSTLVDVLRKKNIQALFLTNLLGFCSAIDAIKLMCKKCGIILIEDNCEALGSVYRGTKLGNFGLASTFSFYVGHHMSTVEGGAVVTDDEELHTMLNLVRAHGWDRNLTESTQLKIRKRNNIRDSFYSRYTFYDLGYNFRTTEIQGYLGNIQLSYLPKIIKKREDNFKLLSNVLYKNDNYYPIYSEHMEVVSNFAFPIICKTKKIKNELVKKCEGIVEIRPIVGGDMTQQPFYSKYILNDIEHMNNAKLVHEQGLYFGNNPDLTKKDIKTLIHLFNN